MPWNENNVFSALNRPVLSTMDRFSPAGDATVNCRLNAPPASPSAWGAANRAVYIPVVAQFPFTVAQLAIYVGASAGNIDLGLYNETGTLLTSKGSTAMAGATTYQVLDVPDYSGAPGQYFLGAVCSTITTATFVQSTMNSVFLSLAGCFQEALGGSTLANATFAAYASSKLPVILAGGTVL